MKAQSGRILGPNQPRGVTQSMEVWHAGDGGRKVDSIKLRWKLSYRTLGGEQREERGEIPEFGLA